MDIGIAGFESSTFFSGMSMFSTVLLYALYGVLVFGGVYLAYFYFSHKHRVRVRKIVSGRTIIFDDKARQFTDRKGIPKWRLWKMRKVMGLPPDECLDVTSKGKLIAECYWTGDGTPIWINTSFDFDKDKKIVDTFEPFSSEERTMVAHEYREAESYKKRRVSELIVALAPMITIVLILTIFMLFFGEAVAPSISLASSNAGYTQQLVDSCTKMATLCEGGTVVYNEPIPPSEVPN